MGETNLNIIENTQNSQNNQNNELGLNILSGIERLNAISVKK